MIGTRKTRGQNHKQNTRETLHAKSMGKFTCKTGGDYNMQHTWRILHAKHTGKNHKRNTRGMSHSFIYCALHKSIYIDIESVI
jgi:hypothetical protein